MESPMYPHQTCWFIFQNEHLLLFKADNTLPTDLDIRLMAPHFLRQFNLGCVNNIEYHCAEISQESSIPDILYGLKIRQALPLFSHDGYGLAVKAWSVINWDINHQFCSRCGCATTHHHNVQLVKGFERVCKACELSFYPRISPCIIVLIKKDDHLLMARSPHFAPGIYSLIAGFVDVGESIEEAVHREVKEEVGLEITNLQYFGSQPWPFPDSLMLAFTADYASGEIVMEQDEIEDAGWYRHDNLPGLPSVSISIAMKLIEDFIRGN